MDNAADLQMLLRSQHTLIVADVTDEERFLGVVAQAAGDAGIGTWMWTVTRGLAPDGGEPVYGTQPIVAALDFIEERNGRGVYVFADAHSQLGDPVVVRRIKEVCAGLAPGNTVILTGATIEPPAELEAIAHRWRLKPPDGAEIREMVARTLRDLDGRGFVVALGPERFDEVVASVSGVSTRQAERLIQRMALDDGVVGADDLPRLARARAEILAGDGIVELVEATVGTLDDVGGMAGLKEWLHLRMGARETVGGHRLDPPRGILLTGVPGAGKSFVAKTLAATWQRPLLMLDPGKLYAKYLGESEERLRRALETADAMAPVVLWIDEIEKGFARSEAGDGGASARVLGTFLRWLQERTTEVFVVATANDVSALPPELSRKGRFDEVFFVDLPDDEARRAILGLHLARRGADPASFDIEGLSRAAEGFTGAELETAIVSAMYRCTGRGEPLTGPALTSELAATVPLSRSRHEDIAALRRWARERAVAA